MRSNDSAGERTVPYSVSGVVYRVSCDAPAVAVAVPVDAVLEIGDDQPHFHLQPRQNRVERDFPLFRDFRRRVGRRAFSSSSGESQHPAQLPDGGRSFGQDGLQHHVVEGCRILVRSQRPGSGGSSQDRAATRG